MQFKKLLISLLAIAICIITVSPVLAKADYDEDVIRAFKKLKIKKEKTNIQLPEYATEGEIKAEVQAYLLKKKYFRKKLRNKPAVVLATPKIENETLQIKEIYVYKNPEIFLYTYDKNTPKKVLANRCEVGKKIEDNVTLYAISSNKIAKQNQWKIKKVGKFTSNFVLGTFTIIPKLGLGYILNPPFNWLKTGTKGDINKHILKEVEMLMTEEKEYGKVFYIDKKIIVKPDVKAEPKKDIKLEPVKTKTKAKEEKTEEELLKELESIKPTTKEETKVETKPEITQPKTDAKEVSENKEIKTEPEVKAEPKVEPKAEEPKAEVGDKSDTKAKQLEE